MQMNVLCLSKSTVICNNHVVRPTVGTPLSQGVNVYFFILK